MSGVVGRLAQRLLRLRVVSVLLLGVLTYWFAVMAGTYRLPGRLLALTILAGVLVLALDALLLARRVATATPSETSHHLIHVIERYAPLVVLNLMMLNVVAPVLGLAAGAMDYVSFLRAWLTLLGWLSGWVLFCLFALGIVGLLAVLGLRLADRIMLRFGPASRVPAMIDRGIVTLTAVFCAWAMALTFNGTFDGASATEHRSEIVAVWGIPSTPLWWADVRSWDAPGHVKRVLIDPERDKVVPALLEVGHRVRVRIRPGYFGLSWVESMHVDFDHDLEALVAAAPSAATPRKQLIAMLLRDGRWADAATHATTYARHHPDDRAFMAQVAAILRTPRQAEPATALDKATLPVSRGRGP
jgi:hypothetical protein